MAFVAEEQDDSVVSVVIPVGDVLNTSIQSTAEDLAQSMVQ